MLWWQWIVLGALLLGTEMIIDAEFYLVFLGVAAVSVGLFNVAIYDVSVLADWLSFSALAAGSIVLFRSKLYLKIRGNLPNRNEGVIGEFATAIETIAPGALGKVDLRGTSWNARNSGPAEIPAESRIQVVAMNGVTLDVTSETPTSTHETTRDTADL